MSLQRWFLVVGWICVATMFGLAGYREYSQQIDFQKIQTTKQEMKELVIRLASPQRPAEYHGKLGDCPVLANKLVTGLYPDSLDGWGTEYELDFRHTVLDNRYLGMKAAATITIRSAGPNRKLEPGGGDDLEEAKTISW